MKYRSDLTASEADKNTGDDDTSIVFEVVTTFEQQLLDKIPVDDNGNLEVMIQDQTTRMVDVRLARTISGPYTLASDTVPNTYTIELTDATGLTAGDQIGIFQDHATPCSLFAYIKSITDNTLTINVPFDCAFTSANSAVLFEVNNKIIGDGSTTPIVYSVSNGSSVPFDINRLMFKMITETAVELTDFGDIATLTNGIVIRKNNSDGTYLNIMTVRNNSELSLYAYDYQTYDASNPGQGVYGLAARFTLNGQDKHGVVIRLSQGQSLECLVQDDLSDLLDFKIMAEGSYTDEF